MTNAFRFLKQPTHFFHKKKNKVEYKLDIFTDEWRGHGHGPTLPLRTHDEVASSKGPVYAELECLPIKRKIGQTLPATLECTPGCIDTDRPALI